MIIKAAVKCKDKIYIGFDHGECFEQLLNEASMTNENSEQGFIDENNNFFDRKQAMLIAKEMGQLTYETNKQTLISEDLHLNWLNEQDKKIKELETKLAEYESFMEKHNCHSIGDLMLEFTISAVDKLNLKLTEEENQQLKQSQNSKAIEVLERLRQDFFGNPYNGKHEYVVGEIIDKIDIKLTELRGKKND